MFGFVLGTACLVGLGIMARRRRRWYGRGYGYGCGYGPGCGDYGGHGWREHHGWHGHHGPWGGPEGGEWAGPRGGWSGPQGGWSSPQGGWGNRWWRGGLFAAMRRLQLTPDQQTVVREELERLGTTLREHRQEWSQSRRDVAQAVRGESFDATVMGELFGRHDERLGEARKAVMEALGKIHAVLDETQRQRLAELIDRGGGGWHPFRGDMV
jgi:uncharacterized membrane protein